MNAHAQRHSGDDRWVRALLRDQQPPVMPDAVAARISGVIADEQERRAMADLPPRLDPSDLAELKQRTNLGTFGPNPPRSLSRRGLGLSTPDAG